MFDFHWKKYAEKGETVFLNRDLCRLLQPCDWDKIPEDDWHPIPIEHRAFPSEEFVDWAARQGLNWAIEGCYASGCNIFLEKADDVILFKLMWGTPDHSIGIRSGKKRQ